MTETKLMPCPFCGTTPDEYKPGFVSCLNNDCAIGGGMGVRLTAWNRRAPSCAPVAVNSLDIEKSAVERILAQIHGNREKLLAAWIAETGLSPSESVIVERPTGMGGVEISVRRKEPDTVLKYSTASNTEDPLGNKTPLVEAKSYNSVAALDGCPSCGAPKTSDSVEGNGYACGRYDGHTVASRPCGGRLVQSEQTPVAAPGDDNCPVCGFPPPPEPAKMDVQRAREFVEHELDTIRSEGDEMVVGTVSPSRLAALLAEVRRTETERCADLCDKQADKCDREATEGEECGAPAEQVRLIAAKGVTASYLADAIRGQP